MISSLKEYFERGYDAGRADGWFRDAVCVACCVFLLLSTFRVKEGLPIAV